MTKIAKYILLPLFIICYFTSTTKAVIKFDIPQVAHQGVKLPGKVSGIAADTQKQTEHIKTYQKMLDGAKEGLSKVNDLKNATMKLKDQASESFNSLTTQAMDNANGLTNSKAQDLINAQTGLSRSKSECEAKIKELEASRDAFVNKHKENNKILEEDSIANPQNKLSNQKQIEENNQKIAKTEENTEKLIAETRAIHDKINQQYEEQINQLQSEAMNTDPLSNVNADSAQKAMSGMFGGDAGGAMNEIIADNFYAKGEEASSERNGEINHHRRDTVLNDTTEVLYQSVKVMSAGDSGLEYTKSLQSNAQVTETTPAAIMLDLSLKVETLKVMLTYARLLVAEMKMMTAKDMIGLDKKLNNYNKDVTVFNLDDYEYKD